ncbi:MAG: prenyltransferase/squalene oxidase repeat-containing protein [Planctomycetota bacterium]
MPNEDEAPELTEEAEKAIDRGLEWLIKTQNKNGSWSMDNGDYAIAGTSLGLMAFMVEGHFPGFGKYGDALDRAKDYLLKRSADSPTGAMGVKMYEIGLYTIAMSELWGMTKDPEDNKEIQKYLERAVQIILRSQSPLGGWRYAPRPDAGQDTSVTAMVFVSLASAREAGVLVPTESIDRVTGYLRDQVYSEERGGFGYQGPGYTIACTAGGVYAAQLAGNRDTEWVEAALSTLENDPKVFSRKDNGYYYYSHYYAMQAMVQAGDERYAKWYPKIRDSLISLQKPDGSWKEKEEDYPHKTPMSIIILATPNRYIPVYQR